MLFIAFSTVEAKDQGIVSGQVTWEGGYGYISDATIYLYDLSYKVMDSTRTNYKGVFEIAAPAGNYYVSAEKGNLVKEYYSDAYLIREANAIHVSQGQYIQVNFALDSGGWISGTFAYAGSNIHDGLVTVIKVDQPHEGWYKSLTLTGPFPSAYAIQGLIPGTYKILARARGKRTEYYPGVSEIGFAEAINVVKDVGISDIGFMLDEVGWGSIRGRIFNRVTDGGIPGQQLSAYQWHDFWQDPNLMDVVSNSDGSYLLNVPAGDYFLFLIYDCDNGSRIALYYNDCYEPTSAQVIRVAAGQTVQGIDLGIDYSVNHDLTISGAVTGRSTGYGLNNVSVTAINYETGRTSGSGCSNDDGNFMIGDLAPGRYLLMFSGTYIIPYFYPQSANWQDAGIILLQNHMGDVRTEAITQDYGNNGLTIAGTVSSSSGPLVGARVYAYPYSRSEPIAYARTDASGSYAIVSGLIPGRYTISCDLFGYGAATFPYPIYLDLMDNPEATGIDFNLTKLTTAITVDQPHQNKIVVSGNYPNPFNSNTLIRLYSDRSDEISTKITVFNILGQIVGDKDIMIRPGDNFIEWSAADFNREVSSGTYFYRVRDLEDTYRMILLK